MPFTNKDREDDISDDLDWDFYLKPPVDGNYHNNGFDAEKDETPVGSSPSPAIEDQSLMDRSSSGELEEPFTGNATSGLDVDNSPVLSQPLHLTCLGDRMPPHPISEGIYLSPAELSDTMLCASEIAHAPPVSGIAHSRNRRILPKGSPVQSPAARPKPFKCEECPKTYLTRDARRKHEVYEHHAERRPSGRPRNSSRPVNYTELSGPKFTSRV